MPPDLAGEIRRYYAELQQKVGLDRVSCAVRSSGAVSMPGQMETYLNIAGEEAIIEHVKKHVGHSPPSANDHGGRNGRKQASSAVLS